jgi:predicted HAD superfamily phosphohydrolase
MANTFTSYVNQNVGTSAATVVTVGGGTQTTVIGMSCANTTTSPVTVSAYITRSATDYYLIKSATVPVGSSLVIVGGDQKVVLVASDALKVVSSAASSLDVVTSVLNIT